MEVKLKRYSGNRIKAPVVNILSMFIYPSDKKTSPFRLYTSFHTHSVIKLIYELV